MIKFVMNLTPQVLHVFSHIEQTYVIETLMVPVSQVVEDSGEVMRPHKWLTGEDLCSAAISTGMKKCFEAFEKMKHPRKVQLTVGKVGRGAGSGE